MSSQTDPPERVAVIGAGMVGLATAWFLQDRGVEVTVIDREGVAAGSSWGNAGWLTPGICTPLPEPAVLRYGLRAICSPSSPVYVPPSAASMPLVRFLLGFLRHSTHAAWGRAMTKLVSINRIALESFDLLSAGGVAAPTHEARSFTAAWRTPREREAMLAEIDHIRAAGQPMDHQILTGAEARAIEPVLSDQIGAAIVLKDQRFVDPGQYVHALADAVVGRGGEILTGTEVGSIIDLDTQVVIADRQFDAAVIATGAWLGKLAQPVGVRRVVQAGRGYSFSVPVRQVPHGPVYFPAARVAGMMEFRKPDAPLDQRRIAAIVETARPLLTGADLDDRTDEWVGSRPCTSDGLPLVGPTRSRRVFVAGGHGMWGITLGPATGRLLAEQIITGRTPSELLPFDPLR